MNTYPDFSNYGYQITRELGHNRAGGRVTYLATEINTKRSVVVKQFQFARTGAHWSEYQAYEKEIQILRELDHPSIPRYLDSFQTASGFCMVQEYKNAPSLANPAHWNPEQIKQIAISVLEILKYLQNRVPPVIHRDLKPENILVNDRMNVSLVDFGFARIGGGEVAASSVVKGTLGFMPPEQMFNRQLTVASDLYSLGATLICLLLKINSTEVGSLMDDTGRINFKSRLPQLTPEFLDWLQKMVEPNFKHRYASADVALNVLIPLDVLRPNKKSRFALIGVGLLAASAAIIFSFFMKPVEPLKFVKPQRVARQQRLNPRTKVMLTTQLESSQTTLESSQTTDIISMKNRKQVYFVVNFGGLPSGEYESVCKVLDSEGKLVAQGQSILNISADRLNTWCWYKFKDGDKPGDWKFEFYLDGQRIVQNSLNVFP